MSSQYEKNQAKWQAYCDKLAKAGLMPSEQVQKGYAQSSQFWNMADTEANDTFNQVMNQGNK